MATRATSSGEPSDGPSGDRSDDEFQDAASSCHSSTDGEPVEGYGDEIARLDLSPSELGTLLADPFVDDRVSGPDGNRLLIVHDDGSDLERLPSPGSLPVVIALVTDRRRDTSAVGAVDLVVEPSDVDELTDRVTTCPTAATSLAVLLRRRDDGLDVETGLAAESAVYSTLQAGAEFATWRRNRVARPVDADTDADRPAVTIDRIGDRLVVTLDRPERHNAVTAGLRDDLHAALAVAIADPSVDTVELRGSGPSFCSGGDLDEFGRRPDPATAHVTRLARSPARSIHRLRDRTTAVVHGATFGGGIEMAAFAGRVVARPGTRFALPEIGLGLVPGAGGTVSLPRRIGRHRTAWLALTGAVLDAPTALSWGLVDEIDTSRPSIDTVRSSEA